MLSNIQAEIDELKTDRLLNSDPQFSSNREPANEGFYITAEGRLY
jgi:hypothetical protein